MLAPTADRLLGTRPQVGRDRKAAAPQLGGKSPLESPSQQPFLIKLPLARWMKSREGLGPTCLLEITTGLCHPWLLSLENHTCLRGAVWITPLSNRRLGFC